MLDRMIAMKHASKGQKVKNVRVAQSNPLKSTGRGPVDSGVRGNLPHHRALQVMHDIVRLINASQKTREEHAFMVPI